MNCVDVQTSLAEDLISRADDEMADHLSGCPECRKICDELLELEDLSRSLSGRFKVPTEFRDQVLSRLAERRARRWHRICFGVAVLVVVGLIAVFVRPWEAGHESDGQSGPAPVALQLDNSTSRLQGKPDYVDIVVSQDGSDELILRVPSVIEIHRTQLQEDFYIRNVSH